MLRNFEPPQASQVVRDTEFTKVHFLQVQLLIGGSKWSSESDSAVASVALVGM